MKDGFLLFFCWKHSLTCASGKPMHMCTRERQLAGQFPPPPPWAPKPEKVGDRWHTTLGKCAITSAMLFIMDLLLSFKVFCLSFCQFSNRAGWFRSPTDRWNCNTDVLHTWSCDSSWTCLCDSHMAGDSTSYHTSQLSFPVILLVTLPLLSFFSPAPQIIFDALWWVLFNTNSSCFLPKTLFQVCLF